MPKHPPCGRNDAPEASDTHSETQCRPQLAGALMVTAFRLQSRTILPDRGSGGCPDTSQNQPSCPMPKHPLRSRTDAPEASDTHSETVLKAARGSARGNGFSVTESAKCARTWVERLPQHHTVSADLTDVKTPAWWPHRCVRRLGCALRESTWVKFWQNVFQVICSIS